MGTKRAIVLGGTDPHIELIKQLQQRGYYTILVDYLDNPVAKPYADLHVQVSTMVPEEVLKVAKQYDVDLVMTACVDQANITACYVAEKLGLTKPYSYKTAVNITNKVHMKEAMLAHGVPTTKFIAVNDETILSDIDLKYPLIVKPVDSYGTSGVKRVNNLKELEICLKQVQNTSRSGRALIEEYFFGTEVSAYTIVKNHVANVIMISERLSVSEGEEQVLKCYATVTPPNISSAAIEKIKDAATKIAEAFELDNTPLHVQVLVNKDEIDIIEFAARVAGGISYKTVKCNTGMDMISAAIDSYSENSIQLTNHCPEKYYAVNLVYAKNGVFDHVEGIDKLVDDGVIDEYHSYRVCGSKISSERANSCRVAAFITSGTSRDELHEKAVTSFNRLKVIGSNGEDLTRRDLILK